MTPIPATDPALELRTPLQGIRVVEWSTEVAGAYCGRVLSDLGADVDRVAGPLDVDCDPAIRDAVLLALNDGKGEVAAGQSLEASLAAANVLVFDADPEQAPAALAAIAQDGGRPDLIVVRTGSRRSPEGELVRDRSGITAAAASSLAWVIGDPGRAPLTLPFDIVDYQAGVHAAGMAALAVLLRRRGGTVQRLDVSATDVLAYYVGMIASNFVPYERPWQREGRRNAGSGGFYPSAMFPCVDGYVGIMCRVEREWRALIEGMGAPMWSRDPRFADPRVIARLHADEVDEYLTAWTSTMTRDEVLAVGREHGFPVAPIRTMTEALREQQFAERGYFRELERGGRRYRAPGQPYHMSPPRRVEPATRPTADGRGRGQGPLSGLRVLDLSWVWSGPMVTSVLADLGAEILKIEHWSRPDAARVRGPAIRGGVPVEAPEYEASPYFNQINHGKRSIMVDLQQPEGSALVRRLATTCDIVVENMRPGVLRRRGLDYGSLAEVNPSLVYLSMSMAGQAGPLSDIKGYAPVMSGMAGLESVVGYGPDDVVGMFTTAFGDPNAASHALVALFAALHRREAGGGGAWIDISQIEALMSVMQAPAIHASLLGTDPAPPANTHSIHSPHGIYPCAGHDRWVALLVRDDAEWAALCDALAPADAAARLRTAGIEQRRAARADLDAEIASWTARHDRDDIVTELARLGIPVAPVRTYGDLVGDPECLGGGGVDVPHPYLGSQFTFVLPWRIDGRTYGALSRAPFLGEHTRADLARLLGLGDEELDRLESVGAIA